ncbi:unnamed protein product [Spirodela intermedia]|uniref:t-SNARE coiled-coil homology domain-containing protein n=1 Tax=Spirodela intermedia TaxID=51605 RepID=A0A7I8J0V2_SPIIN|nr:unnamed protein product [Spirodela intermedia]CAA6663845.1 unnamed protein product [Spirodela intermedia]
MNDLMTKSFMSYVDLKKEALKDLEAGGGEDFGDVEMWSAATADGNLRSFFEEAGRVRDEMDEIRELLVRLQEANEEGRSLHKPESLKSLRARINGDVVNVLKKARDIRNGTPVDRTRTSITNGLRKKLKDLMMDFQTLRQKMMAEYKETVERRYFTVTGQMPEEEMIEKIISHGESEDLLKKAIEEHGRGKVLATVHEIQDRHDAAKEIERSLLELHQVFLDMALMVEAQGEQMDDIEHHQLATAKQHQRSSRKWLFIGLLLLLILILVVVVPVATSLRSS